MKLVKDKKKILKTYSFLSIAANFATALSVSALAVLGVLSAKIALPTLIATTTAFGLIGLVGRFIDQQLDDSVKVNEVECTLKKMEEAEDAD